jgi:hypothetical protein
MLTEGFGLIAAGIKVLEDIDSNGQTGAATTRQGIIRMLACCEEILYKKRTLSRQSSYLD